MTAQTANGFTIFPRSTATAGPAITEGRSARGVRSGGTGRHGGRGTLFARLAAYISEKRHQFAVMNELSELSDRELSDIGLVRSDIPRIFDRGFAERHEAGRGTAF